MILLSVCRRLSFAFLLRTSAIFKQAWLRLALSRLGILQTSLASALAAPELDIALGLSSVWPLLSLNETFPSQANSTALTIPCGVQCCMVVMLPISSYPKRLVKFSRQPTNIKSTEHRVHSIAMPCREETDERSIMRLRQHKQLLWFVTRVFYLLLPSVIFVAFIPQKT